METSFSRRYWSASAMLNRVRSFFQTPAGAINSHLLPYFVTPVLLEFLQLNYQNQHNTPFETHPISMCIATASFLAYCLAHDANLRFSARRQFSPTCLNIVRFSAWFLGQLSLASLAAVLFPNSVAFIPYVSYCALAVGELLYCAVYYRTMGDRIRQWLFHGRFGLVVMQQRLLSLWTSMADQILDGHFQGRLGLLQPQQWLGMRLYQLPEWLFQGRLGQVMQRFVLMRRPIRVNHGVNQAHVLPVYRAPRH